MTDRQARLRQVVRDWWNQFAPPGSYTLWDGACDRLIAAVETEMLSPESIAEDLNDPPDTGGDER